ncbi:MAG: enoyl-CoA hydratase/isomerase family protein [Acidobacteriota bacterium]
MDAAHPCVTLTVEDGLGTLLMQGRHANALNADLLEALTRTLQQAETDRGVRGLMLASAGKLFSPGLDLVELIEYDRATMSRFMERFDSCLFALYTCSKPVVAAVSGHAVAGGCVLALATDHRVLREDAMIGLNEVQVGVPLPFGVALLLRETVGPRRLEEVALLGRNYTNEEAVEVGLVHEVADARDFGATCRERLAGYAAKDPCAFAATKHYLRRPTVERIRASDALFRPEFLDCWFSDRTQERIRAMVDSLQSRSGKAR